MAKFLNTTGVSYHLEELIIQTKEWLFLFSPYLQFNKRIREHIQHLHADKCDIRIIFRENKLQKDEREWLESLDGIRVSECPNLHAKCYLNESQAIITSMNLYEFSQLHNNEMGVLITRSEDTELYNATTAEAKRLLTISKEIGERKKNSRKSTEPIKEYGFCIRTGVRIPFNVEKPMSYDAFREWSKYSNVEYPESFCHFSGEASKGETCFIRPVLKKNWKAAQEKLYN